MDTAAYLKRQGWQGDGHALSSTGNGLKKPLLVSKKVDVLGLGVNKHAAVSDQWWMRAFDQGLKDLGTGKRTVLGDVRAKGVAHGGLYGRFVKGEGVPGTFEPEALATVTVSELAQLKSTESNSSDSESSSTSSESSTSDDESVEPSKTTEKSEDIAIQVPSKKRKREPDATITDGLRPFQVKRREERAAKKARKAEQKAEKEKTKKAIADAAPDKGKKQTKYDREKQARAKKRAVREQLSPEQREKFKGEEIAAKARKHEKRKAAEIKVEAQKLAEVEAKALRKVKKAERRARRDARKADRAANPKDNFADGTDEIKLHAVSQDRIDTTETAGQDLLTKKKKKEEEKPKQSGMETVEKDPPDAHSLGFIVDTEGDAVLSKVDDPNVDIVTVVDRNGNVRHSGHKDDIPMDPNIWKEIDVKKLPRPVREKRREWMAQQREARKAKTTGSRSADKKTTKTKEGRIKKSRKSSRT